MSQMEEPFSEPEQPAPPDPEAYIEALRAALLGQESRGDFDVRGQKIVQGSKLKGEQAMGGFQIMPSTARSLMERFQGLQEAVPQGNVEEALMADPALQERFMAALLAANAQDLGSLDPKALILAHYAGTTPARQYLQSGEMSDRPIMTTGRPNPSHLQYVNQVMGRLGDVAQPELEAFIQALLRRAGQQ